MGKYTNSGSKTLAWFQLYGQVGDVGLWEPGRPPHGLTKDPQRLFPDKKKLLLIVLHTNTYFPNLMEKIDLLGITYMDVENHD